MHSLILGERNANAQQRILVDAGLLAAHFKIDPTLATALKVQEKDPVIRAMKEREAIANLLDGIAVELGLLKPTPAETGEEVPPQGEPAVTAETGEGLPEPVLEDDIPVERKSRRAKQADV